MNSPVLSAAQAVVVWIALIRCAWVAMGILRQLLRRNRAVVNKWGWVETLTTPEPVLLFAATLFLYRQPEAAAGAFPTPLALSGALLAIAALVLSLWAVWCIPSLSSGHYVLPDQQVVDRGPYGWVRHPHYLGVFLIWLGLAGAYASLLVLAVTLVYVVPIYVLYVRSEEEMLQSQFGDEYRRYRKRVGMFLPRLRRTQS